MNIGGLYNVSSIFQSMYNTNSYGSSSMASLTNTVLGGSSVNSIYSSLSDRSLIQSGSYGKLLNAYYAGEATDKVVADTEDGKVVEKTEASDKQAKDAASTEKSTDVLSDLMRRNRAISYTNMGGIIKNMSTPSFDYIV